MELADDVLDAQLLDGRRRKIGTVDDVVLVWEDGPPRAEWIESGPEVLARRVHPALARVAAWFARRTGFGRTRRVPLDGMTLSGVDVVVPVDGDEAGALLLERWLARRVVGRIPGAG